jgi:hypothetical protein
VFRARLLDFGARYYGSLGIDRNDTSARMRQTEQNFSFFGAPVGLIFSIDRRLKPHSWIDLGPLRAERDDRREGARRRHLPAGCIRAIP